MSSPVSIDLIVLGGGGHGRVLLDAISLLQPTWKLAVLDPDVALHGSLMLGWKVLGDDSLMSQLAEDNPGLRFTVGIGAIKASPHRQRLFELARAQGLRPFTVVHPTAFVSPHADVDAGAQVMAGAVVHTLAHVHENAIVNTRAVVEHDCVVGRHAHVASGSCLSGGVRVGDGALVGAGATVRQYLGIGDNAVVGAGSVVVKDVPAGETVVGVPARPLRRK